ncbi:hypothetical protein AB0E67_27295 [Streptomyces sp. NPDC032161]|uniref:hypothetical protein n=1 Tax=unclassified Streptomyces TaxID=2593676 RepID=UPI0033E9A4F4
MTDETPLDRIARALSKVPIRHTDDGIPVCLDLAICLEYAHVALSVIRPEMDQMKQRLAELEGSQPVRVLPAKFVTDAMNRIPDSLPPDFA